MKNIKQCDRCKRIDKGIKEESVMTVKFPKKRMYIWGWTDAHIDLCTPCLKEFLGFIKQEPLLTANPLTNNVYAHPTEHYREV